MEEAEREEDSSPGSDARPAPGAGRLGRMGPGCEPGAGRGSGEVPPSGGEAEDLASGDGRRGRLGAPLTSAPVARPLPPLADPTSPFDPLAPIHPHRPFRPHFPGDPPIFYLNRPHPLPSILLLALDSQP